jgi:hypothetical protein
MTEKYTLPKKYMGEFSEYSGYSRQLRNYGSIPSKN